VIYGREALRRFREQREQVEARQGREADLLSQIPADAPTDDATLTVWNGERWIAWEKWLATAPILVEEQPPKEEKAAPVKQQRGLW
jgi:hypothetical protein